MDPACNPWKGLPMKEVLHEEIHAKISELCARGDALAHSKAYADAIQEYRRAWDLLPEPKMKWKAAAWILAALGDAYFQSGEYKAAADIFSEAILNIPGGLGNPFFHLRLGQSLFELGDRRKGADELMRAYMGAGEEIFGAEDPKYLQYLKTVAQI
jgi:tetratricopeptide (TPR) repeat protein